MSMLLNLACGKKTFPDCVNMDIASLPGVDVVHNAYNFPWPFKHSTFDAIFANHFFEHIPHLLHDEYGIVAVMRECHRVLRNSGLLYVTTPHWKALDLLWSDPTHLRPLTPQTWEHFDPNSKVANWYAPDVQFELLWHKISARGPRWPTVLPIRGHGLMTHIHDRLYSKWPVSRPIEIQYILRKLSK